MQHRSSKIEFNIHKTTEQRNCAERAKQELAKCWDSAICESLHSDYCRQSAKTPYFQYLTGLPQ